MIATVLSVLCTNCGGDALLSELVDGTTVCPWCGLSFHDDFAPAGESRPIFLAVVLAEKRCIRSTTTSKEVTHDSDPRPV